MSTQEFLSMEQLRRRADYVRERAKDPKTPPEELRKMVAAIELLAMVRPEYEAGRIREEMIALRAKLTPMSLVSLSPGPS